MRIQKTVKPLEGPVGDNSSGWHNAARLESCVRDGRSGMSSVVDVEGIATCAGAIDAFITTSHTSSARGTALNELYKRCHISKNRPSCPSLNLCSVALEEEKNLKGVAKAKLKVIRGELNDANIEIQK